MAGLTWSTMVEIPFVTDAGTVLPKVTTALERLTKVVADAEAAATSWTGATRAMADAIEVVCIGLVIGGTSADVLFWAAYGTNKRA
jgi:hypothetical protein